MNGDKHEANEYGEGYTKRLCEEQYYAEKRHADFSDDQKFYKQQFVSKYPKPSKKKSVIIKAGVAAVALIAAATLAVSVFDSTDNGKTDDGVPAETVNFTTPGQVVESYIDAMFAGDVDGVIGCLPDRFTEKLAAARGISEDELISEFADKIIGTTKNFPENYTRTVLYSEAVSDGELSALSDDAAGYGYTVTDAKRVHFTLTAGDSSDTTYFIAVEIEGMWYINPDEVF